MLSSRSLGGGACRAPHRQNYAPQSCVVKASTSIPAVGVDALGLVLGRGEEGSWDSHVVGNPVVRCYVGDNEERWFMWYSGASSGSASESSDGGDAAPSQPPPPGLAGVSPGAGSVGVAVSADGVIWTRGGGAVEGSRGAARAADVGMCLTPTGADYWWTLDTHHLAVSDVQVFSNSSVSSGVGVYWMFYTGGDFAPLEAPAGLPGVPAGAAVEGLRMRPGLAMSQDGRNWARIEGDHHTGALFDAGEPGEWDELFAGHPCVIAAGPRDMRMFYHSWDARQGRFAVGLATSPDGFKWTKRGPVFDGSREPGAHDELGAAACQVVVDPDNRRFLMFYEAVAADGTRSIGVATSADGRKGWRRAAAPLLAPSADAGAWDAGGVGAPCAVPMAGGRWRLYYAGRGRGGGGGPGRWEGVGLALSEQGAADAAAQPFKRRTGAAEPGAQA
ncbi:MAG: glycosyl hydrolase [Monoraphidium minutum]|nr:MAG: glycosyl hydrolase [Monoraphidium minutum]